MSRRGRDSFDDWYRSRSQELIHQTNRLNPAFSQNDNRLQSQGASAHASNVSITGTGAGVSATPILATYGIDTTSSQQLDYEQPERGPSATAQPSHVPYNTAENRPYLEHEPSVFNQGSPVSSDQNGSYPMHDPSMHHLPLSNEAPPRGRSIEDFENIELTTFPSEMSSVQSLQSWRHLGVRGQMYRPETGQWPSKYYLYLCIPGLMINPLFGLAAVFFCSKYHF